MSTDVIEELRARMLAGEKVTAAQLGAARNTAALDLLSADVAEEVADIAAIADLADRRRQFIARTLDNEELKMAGAARDRLAEAVVTAARNYEKSVYRFNAAVTVATAECTDLEITDRDAEVHIRRGSDRGLYVRGVRLEQVQGLRSRAARTVDLAMGQFNRTASR